MQYAYVIHYDAPDWCRRTVASLQASEPGLTVVVVDNGGAALSLPPDVPVLRPGRNSGYTGGANTAVADWWGRRDATGPFVVCCHDVDLSHGALSAMARALDDSARLGIVSPVVRQSGQQTGAQPGRALQSGGETVQLCDWVPGTCVAVSRACLAALGGFDESFGSYVEDIEVCLRARDLGWEVGLLPAYTALGEGSASTSWRKAMYVNNVRLALYRGGRPAAVRRLLAHTRFALVTLATARGDRAARPGARARLAAVPAAARLIATRPEPDVPPARGATR